MRAHVLTVAERAPVWVRQGFEEYARRLEHKLPLVLNELPLGPRGKSADPKRAIADEGVRMHAALPKQARVIALDGRGEQWSSEALAKHLVAWLQDGRDLAFLIGGPDGLAPQCLLVAHQKWSLGPLTLPHALVRIVLAEQIYRAVSMLGNHPYHRA
jgi:23S rRNA (pseudouridine1915-N3)-methyltransferase